MNKTLTIAIYADTVDGAKPAKIAIITIRPEYIVSAVFHLQTKEYMITLAGQETNGRIYEKWFPKTKVNSKSKQIESIPDQYEKETVGEFTGQPTAISVRDDEQIEKVWRFLNPGENFELLREHEDFKIMMEEERVKTIRRQEALKREMNDSGLVDTAGRPLTADTVGNIIPVEAT